ncbi:MAG TPA: CDP-alcohol phosphatidyltransferase family protein [Steroidobacteraceae bacterium]|jgi:archaetidylinositol phosphate synthase|nr:CDP-alcohol phosphatidyltransferase family protein [Steroidobacteraceae bacterium]
MVRPLLGSRVTPNHLTTLRLFTGVAACLLFSLGTRAGMWWGGGLWLLSAFLDRADGELARIGNMMTPGGHRYDYYSDSIVNSVFFVSIGIGLRHSWLGSWSIPLGLVSGAAVFLGGLFAEWLELRSPPGTQAYSGKWGFDLDDALYLMGPLAWFGWLSPILVGASVGATAMMLITGLRLLRVRG